MSKLIKKLFVIALSVFVLISALPVALAAEGEAAAASDPVFNIDELYKVGKTEVGIYTVFDRGNKIYHIQDANTANPAGYLLDANKKLIGMNNTSEMYLIVGKTSSLLIDLSNKKEDGYAALRAIVSKLSGTLPVKIAITHGHGDHTGQLAAFANAANVTYYFPKNDWSDTYKASFPADTVQFEAGYQFDLGGRTIDTVQCEGHTAGSIVFYEKATKIGFSGDAVGSGSGIWLFGTFTQYKNGLQNLLAVFDKVGDMELYGGHVWQQNTQNGYIKLNRKYCEDMLTIISNIAAGNFEAPPLGYETYFDTNITYGTAAITTTRAAACAYALANGNKWMPFKDVAKGSAYYNAVNYCIAAGLFKGTSYTTFSPDAYLTRAQLAVLLGRVSGAAVDHTKASAFSDVAADKWSNGYITWAVGKGAMKGFGGGTFRPTQAATIADVKAALKALYDIDLSGNPLFSNAAGNATRAQAAQALMIIQRSLKK